MAAFMGACLSHVLLGFQAGSQARETRIPERALDEHLGHRISEGNEARVDLLPDSRPASLLPVHRAAQRWVLATDGRGIDGETVSHVSINLSSEELARTRTSERG